jgi:hypothetical protein
MYNQIQDLQTRVGCRTNNIDASHLTDYTKYRHGEWYSSAFAIGQRTIEGAEENDCYM